MQILRAPPSGQFRAGGLVLSLFATPLNALILQQLSKEKLCLRELRTRVGCPAQTTLRAHLDDLIDLGLVAKLERRNMPYSVAHELTPSGVEMLFVAQILETWLAEAPQDTIQLGSEPAKPAVKALSGGWDSSILRALAAQPRTLTELDNMISHVSYPTIDRRLQAMKITGQVVAVPATNGQGKGTPYAPTDWVRRGIAPLSVAGRWERRHLPEETEPITWVEVEAAFLLTLPLVELPRGIEGECVLAVDTKDPENRIAGVHLTLQGGRLLTCDPSLKAKPPTLALGSAESWLDAVIDGQIGQLHMKGDRRLVSMLVEGLHKTLFG